MRVAFFVPSFPELSETFLLRQVTGLLDRGHDVTIFARQPASDGPAHEAFAAYGLARRVRVLPHGDDAGPLPGVRRAARRAQALAMLAADGRHDVVHGHYGDVALRARAAARLWRAPLVASFYGYDCSSYPRAAGASVYASLFAAAGAVASLGAHMDAQLATLGCPPGLLRRVPLAVDADAYRPDPARPRAAPGAPVRLLTVARLVEKKGHEVALHALARLTDEFPALAYDVVGDGPLRPALRALADALGVGGRVRFLGALPDTGVRAAFAAADLFVLPSVTAADGDEEGTPVAAMEAACCGLPVVATRHAGLPELVRDGESGVLVPERDPDALAAALRALLRAPERWAAMGEAGRRHVAATHAVPAVAARLEAVYEELRAAGRGAGVLGASA